MRYFLAYLVAPFLQLTGYRFSKRFRYGDTAFHRAVYACVSTVKANVVADMASPLLAIGALLVIAGVALLNVLY